MHLHWQWLFWRTASDILFTESWSESTETGLSAQWLCTDCQLSTYTNQPLIIVVITLPTLPSIQLCTRGNTSSQLTYQLEMVRVNCTRPQQNSIHTVLGLYWCGSGEGSTPLLTASSCHPCLYEKPRSETSWESDASELDLPFCCWTCHLCSSAKHICIQPFIIQ